MEKLNCDLFHLLEELLTFKEYHRLMNTSKMAFGSIKAATIVFPLSVEGTRRFLTDEVRKVELTSLLDKPDYQIELIFSKYVHQFQSLTDTLYNFSNYLSCGNIINPGYQILSLRMNYYQYKDHLTKNKIERVMSLSSVAQKYEDLSPIGGLTIHKQITLGYIHSPENLIYLRH
jgi:hypothetical protein